MTLSKSPVGHGYMTRSEIFSEMKMQKALSRSSSDQKFRRAGQRFIEDPSDIDLTERQPH
jgi:hypothetical protein